MFLSIIIPVYNAEKYLAECLDSLLDQDISRNEYEIICINDGSTDRSLDILQSYKQNYPCIRIIDQPNAGVGSARNAGLKSAQGRYIWFVDADDFIQKAAFGKLNTAAGQSDCDMLTVGCYTFFESLSDEEQDLKDRGRITENLFGNDVYVILHLFKTSFLKENNLYFRYPDLSYSEDSIFVYEVNRSRPVRVSARDVIYYYRRNLSSATLKQLVSMMPKIKSHLLAAGIARRYYVSGDRNSAIANIWMGNLWSGMQELSLCHSDEIKRELKKLRLKSEWPVKRPPECTLSKSYMTSRTDLFGKAYDWIYMHTHTYLGFKLMRLFNIINGRRKSGRS